MIFDPLLFHKLPNPGPQNSVAHFLDPSHQNAAINELRRSKRRFEERLAENIKTDSKTFFRYVRSKVGSRDRIGTSEG